MHKIILFSFLASSPGIFVDHDKGQAQVLAMMPAPANIAKAESTAFSGESQDSQLILDAYLKQYGIGAVSGCPLPIPACYSSIPFLFFFFFRPHLLLPHLLIYSLDGSIM